MVVMVPNGAICSWCMPIIVVTNHFWAISCTFGGDILAGHPAPSYQSHHLSSKLISSCSVVFFDMFSRSFQGSLYFSGGVVAPMCFQGYLEMIGL
jgi:hypothetical protein